MLDIAQGNDYNSCAVMKYYYLNADKKIQGPYSASEIVYMQQDGTIDSTTLLAAAGDNRWRPASSFTFEVTEEHCSTWNNNEIATVCYRNASKRFGVLSGISRMFTWQGRMNRKKFCLAGCALAGFAALLVSSPGWVFSPELAEEILAKSSNMEPAIEFVKNLQWYIILYAYFLIFSWPVLFFSLLSLLVRRFHDVGLSAIWAFLAYLFLSASLFLEDFTTQMTLLYTLDAIVVLFLLIVCLWPGVRGDNRYGVRQ